MLLYQLINAIGAYWIALDLRFVFEVFSHTKEQSAEMIYTTTEKPIKVSFL